MPFYKYPVATGAGLHRALALTVLTIVGSSNAVNLTDGLDGLAIGCTLIVSFVFVVLTYVAGQIQAAAYLQIPSRRGAGELTVFCAAMIGAGLGFLWFNCHPAQVFMGDTGSLALGGALGIIAVLIHQPLVLVIAGGVFVMEAFRSSCKRDGFATRGAVGDGTADFFDGTDSSSLREKRLVRIASGDAILHFGRAVRRGGIEHVENPVTKRNDANSNSSQQRPGDGRLEKWPSDPLPFVFPLHVGRFVCKTNGVGGEMHCSSRRIVNIAGQFELRSISVIFKIAVRFFVTTKSIGRGVRGGTPNIDDNYNYSSARPRHEKNGK